MTTKTRPTQPLTSRELVRVDAAGRLMVRKYRLMITAGPAEGRSVRLEKMMAVGSDPQAGLSINDPTVSRLHVQLTPRPDGVLVKDLNSMNGTLVGGLRIESALIENEATLKLGESMLRVQVDESEIPAPTGPSQLGDAVAKSAAMRRVLGLLERLAPTDAPVLLLGETGTGKDVLAHALHRGSSRVREPMVVFDCSAVAANLIESELFGHTKGAFTGAVGDRKGAFLAADGGTLFLDEIGELPLELQPRLLRAVESGIIKPLGTERTHTVDVRLVAATHRNLEEEVRAGRFRQDLYYRLAVAVVRVPPLRERTEDLPILVERFLAQLGRSEFTLPRDLMAKMVEYHWPGNVRELRNVVARATLGEADALTVSSGSHPNLTPVSTRDSSPQLEVPFKEAKERLVDSFTRGYVEALLKHHHGNVSRAARSAGLARPYLHKLAVKFGFKDEGPDKDS
jgi:two-component system, NtrC family, response regulator GlrR